MRLVRRQRTRWGFAPCPLHTASPPSQDSHAGSQLTSKSKASKPLCIRWSGRDASPATPIRLGRRSAPYPRLPKRAPPPSPSSTAVCRKPRRRGPLTAHSLLPMPGGCVILPRFALGSRWPGPAPPRETSQKREEKKIWSQTSRLGKTAESAGRKEEEGGR